MGSDFGARLMLGLLILIAIANTVRIAVLILRGRDDAIFLLIACALLGSAEPYFFSSSAGQVSSLGGHSRFSGCFQCVWQ